MAQLIVTTGIGVFTVKTKSQSTVVHSSSTKVTVQDHAVLFCHVFALNFNVLFSHTIELAILLEHDFTLERVIVALPQSPSRASIAVTRFAVTKSWFTWYPVNVQTFIISDATICGVELFHVYFTVALVGFQAPSFIYTTTYSVPDAPQ